MGLAAARWSGSAVKRSDIEEVRTTAEQRTQGPGLRAVSVYATSAGRADLLRLQLQKIAVVNPSVRKQADWLWDIVRPIRMLTSSDSYSPKGRYHALRLLMALFPGSSSRWTTRSVVSPTSFAQAVVGALPAALPSFASDRRRVATAHIPSPTRCAH